MDKVGVERDDARQSATRDVERANARRTRRGKGLERARATRAREGVAKASRRRGRGFRGARERNARARRAMATTTRAIARANVARCARTSRREARARRSATARGVRCAAAASEATEAAAYDDGFVGRAATATTRPGTLAKTDEVVALRSARAPTNRAEEYRFTDFSALTTATLVGPKEGASADASATRVEDACATVVLVDGVLDATQSDFEGAAKAGIKISVGADATTGKQSATRGNVFAAINSASAADVVFVRVPKGVKCASPVHIVTMSTGGENGATRVSAPRITIVVEEEGELCVVEDFAGEGETEYWQNGVCEIAVEKGASMKHALIQNHGRGATHTRTTLVTQAEDSKYEVNEISVGGKTARHDLNIKQLGPRTETVLGCFNLAGSNQTLDLHSKLQLDHEEGSSNQVHKCIVSAASGKGVFDGNVQVNRMAQRTDAQQLSRNLLLVPKATVNVKPNLQIIADDVKCTHGCTVSDLEEEELFYIRSRGLSAETARSLLVSGFGVDVISRLPGKDLRDRVNSIVRTSLERDRVAFEWTGDS